ncbi:MAG: hypothetical protein US83_C0016G0021 [Candidatus Falkowbacteria bacterium GW2011_GWC2_38_22]|uniref:Uncharacterized protein n=1 Tax=Candidatus Falkowbacteria bacterium GW2011_GWE1_38_31 TaxID=1618638 RepID=A0A0G0JSK1_9BACT|nr:MAG: hypothetical protein US73_C0014G0021 [Candidatus Falkowbacteria bacterium GW2011_GWF2_38_1205]KKQ60549.1 MAG: hypothetical protein US83_C0016G0021 [Candidatus Falkowbacteria bacterium GW2011_GWC2_38_22]KKQ62668.1 MAG: hypothetical protein US84_C0013G0021 [Candidatus Falkowbacteria bacterium GW2011_GWF1_38_22]KKQ64728.1 MAG: hypothetical protein US87_C0013G0021 [Candidatus Falkowbacteria bacterium GW2011_GWE2_38_254]KKQ69607.1 MAG: hypothetical protein US91_C0012G0021 [Candidatus Falkowb
MPEDKKEILNNNQENIPNVSINESAEDNPENIGRFEQVKPAEIILEKPEQKLEEILDMDDGELGGIVSAGQQRKMSTARAKEIEKVLEKGLDDIYLAMPVEKRAIFKSTGEKTISQINGLIEAGKVNMKKVIDLIRSWLSLIPGVNKFFLEQEAKIKADEILNLSKKNNFNEEN